MAIENSVSNDFVSTLVDGINVFGCRLSGVSLTVFISCTRLAPDLKKFINVSYHILVASLTLMLCFKTEPPELDWQSHQS